MRINIKRLVSSVLLTATVLGCVCLAAHAAETTVDTTGIRVFNENAKITVNLTGEPGKQVSVAILKPGVNLPDSSTIYSEFVEGVEYALVINLDDEGKKTFNYTADEVGIYTVRVRGAEIEYTATGNDAPVTNPDRIYVEAWGSGSSSYGHADLNSAITLSKAQLDAYGTAVIAETVKNKLDLQSEGRRTIFIANDLMPLTLGDNRLWWDEGVIKTAAILDEFFKTFRDIGGTVDFIHTDTEQRCTMWQFTDMTDEEYLETISGIAADERYPEFKAKLLERGYDTSKDNGVELQSVRTYGQTVNNYLIFDAVCMNMAADYLTQAVYEPAKKYFAGVKYTDYGMTDTKLWNGLYGAGGAHRDYVGGNTYRAGTHSSPVLYSNEVINSKYQVIFGVPGEDGSSGETLTTPAGRGADFDELQGTILKLRAATLSSENGGVIPWIATEPISSTSYTDERYRSEAMFHIALHNPDRLLYFNDTEDSSSKAEQAKNLMAAMDEVNNLIACADRRSLNTDQTDFNAPFTLSGIYANGKNIWRITPDTEMVSDFLPTTEGDALVFATDYAKISFPQGSIINVENTVSDIGCWVETPEDITPVISYSDQSGTEAAVISFYDEVGQKADLTSGEAVDAVASYKNFYGDKLNFIAAKYDANGMLIDIETKECGVFAPYGNAAFLGISTELDTDSIKFFLWEDKSIRPLATDSIE